MYFYCYSFVSYCFCYSFAQLFNIIIYVVIVDKNYVTTCPYGYAVFRLSIIPYN